MLKIKSEDITLTSTDFRNNYFTDVAKASDDDYIITAIAPVSLFDFTDENRAGLDMTYLCKVKSGKLVTIHSFFCFENEDEFEFARNNISFYINNRLGPNENYTLWTIGGILIDTLPAYLSDFEVKSENNNSSFSIDATYNDNEENKHVKFSFSSNIMASILFMESYLKDCVVNNHDYNIAASVGSGKLPDTEIITVESMDTENIKLADLSKNNIAILYNIQVSIPDKNDKVPYSLLALYSVNNKLDRKLFDLNVKTINEIITSDSESLYLSEFYFSATIDGNPYTIYYARNNKTNSYKIFFLSKAISDTIFNRINKK